MTNSEQTAQTLPPHQLGDTITYRGISVTPIFPARDPICEYVSYTHAVTEGFSVKEVSESGSVGQVIADNPTGSRVLLYDGEEVRGAKQDRIVNVAVLVEAGSKTHIPVSCVEQGRWRRESEAFRPSDRMPSPKVRQSKAERLTESPLEVGLAQSAVWDAVSMKQREHRFASATCKHGDLIDHERPRLKEFVDSFPIQPGQTGMVFGTNGKIVAVDFVSRPDVYRDLHEALLTGYMLDAISHVDRDAPHSGAAREFMEALSRAQHRSGPAAGLGTDVRIVGKGVVGSALTLDGETLQLTAFGRDDSAEEPGSTRIARTSLRSHL
mgnify:CR=1 FL=1